MKYVRYETAKKFWEQCVESVTTGGAGLYLENVLVQFSNDAKAGKYDSISDDEYAGLLNEVKSLAELWGSQPRRTAGELLLNALERTTVPPEQMKPLVEVLAKCFADSDQDKNSNDGANAVPVFMSACAARSPQKIRDGIARHVLGQTAAVRTAAMITYNHLSGRRANAVFCGPSGCGKSEIWRCLSKEYPGLIRMVDFSRFSADGWKGSLHLRDIFDGTDPEDIQRQGLIVVLDEADKVVCEHAMGAGGTDYNAIVQNSLLKMLDGDVIEFGKEEGKGKLSVDCSKVSVVLLGAFETLLAGKTGGAKHIGFGAAPKADAGRHRDISYDDLISAGMRREVAGRINKIVALDPLTVSDYKSILTGPVLSGIEELIGCHVHIDSAAAGVLAEQAAATGLGVRWMRSTVQNAIDDTMFDAPDAAAYAVTVQGGEVRCRAWMPWEIPPSVSRAARDRLECWMSA